MFSFLLLLFFLSFSLPFSPPGLDTLSRRNTYIRIYPKILTYAYIFLCIVSHLLARAARCFPSLRVARHAFPFLSLLSLPLTPPPSPIVEKKRGDRFPPVKIDVHLFSMRITNCPVTQASPLSSRAELLAALHRLKASVYLPGAHLRMCRPW